MRAFFVLTASVCLAACLSSDPISGNGGAGGESSDGGSPPTTYVGGQEPMAGGDVGDPCGDGVCSIDETCTTCPEDCPCSGPVCGDGTCDASTEDCDTCEEDCGACATCGDDVCDPEEDCDTCFEDCGVCMCEPDDFEPNPGSGTATNISLGVDYCDLSICATDVDWFEFQVDNSTTIKLTFNHAEGDLELEIFSEDTGQYVTGSYSADNDELVTLTNQPAGTYWARVYGDAASPINPDYCIRVD